LILAKYLGEGISHQGSEFNSLPFVFALSQTFR
jgi:hypothetical protein